MPFSTGWKSRGASRPGVGRWPVGGGKVTPQKSTAQCLIPSCSQSPENPGCCSTHCVYGKGSEDWCLDSSISCKDSRYLRPGPVQNSPQEKPQGMFQGVNFLKKPIPECHCYGVCWLWLQKIMLFSKNNKEVPSSPPKPCGFWIPFLVAFDS